MNHLLIFLTLLTAPVAYAGFSFQYSNDFFTGTDRYFTQGIELDYKADSLKAYLPKTPLFIKPTKIVKTNYSLGLDYFGFTPKDPYPVAVQLNDRPFANVFIINATTESYLKKNKIKVMAALKLGLIGPLSGGEFVHKTIHKATGNRFPRGWDNQIKNDLLLSYEASLTKHFKLVDNLLEIEAFFEVEVGTYKVRQLLGGTLKAGKLNSFEALAQDQKMNEYYLFLSPRISRVYFDATLQGGIIKRDSPYQLNSSDVEDYVGSLDIGVHLGFKSFSLQYEQAWMTKEFSFGEKHSFGKLSLLFNY